jgi:membrane fusion protein (multidrug efflux system)
MKSRNLTIGALLLAAIAAGAYYWHGQGGAAVAADSAAPADTGVVLVQTAMPGMRAMPLSMAVFGEVAAGKVESLSFPQAGQISRVAVLAGQAVRRGDLLATLASDPAAVAAYAQATSALAFAQREQRRLQDLLALQLATQSQVDSATRQSQDAEAALAAQTRLGGAHASAQLLAQSDGVVTAIPVAQGDRVAAGATVVQVGRTDTLRIQLALEPSRAGELKAGMKVALRLPQDQAPTISATIAQVQTLVDPKTQMASAIVLLPARPAAPLPVGLRLQAVVELGSRDAWAVPRQAVLLDDAGAYLYQVVKDKARRVPVRKLVENGATLGVEGKLDAALPVVVVGNYELQDGARVRGGAL